jgi:hypothetical protein
MRKRERCNGYLKQECMDIYIYTHAIACAWFVNLIEEDNRLCLPHESWPIIIHHCSLFRFLHPCDHRSLTCSSINLQFHYVCPDLWSFRDQLQRRILLPIPPPPHVYHHYQTIYIYRLQLLSKLHIHHIQMQYLGGGAWAKDKSDGL